LLLVVLLPMLHNQLHNKGQLDPLLVLLALVPLLWGLAFKLTLNMLNKLPFPLLLLLGHQNWNLLGRFNWVYLCSSFVT